MKTIEAAIILPIILILFLLATTCCIVVYAHSSKFSSQYLKTNSTTRQAPEMLNYDFKQIYLKGLKLKSLGKRNIKLISLDCRANEILELVYFVKDELVLQQ